MFGQDRIKKATNGAKQLQLKVPEDDLVELLGCMEKSLRYGSTLRVTGDVSAAAFGSCRLISLA